MDIENNANFEGTVRTVVLANGTKVVFVAVIPGNDHSGVVDCGVDAVPAVLGAPVPVEIVQGVEDGGGIVITVGVQDADEVLTLWRVYRYQNDFQVENDGDVDLVETLRDAYVVVVASAKVVLVVHDEINLGVPAAAETVVVVDVDNVLPGIGEFVGVRLVIHFEDLTTLFGLSQDNY